MQIRTQCPHCAAKLRAEERLLGQKSSCPKCRSEFEIMELLDPAPIHEAARPAAVSANQPRGNHPALLTGFPVVAPVVSVPGTVSADRAKSAPPHSVSDETGCADGPLSKPELEQLRDTGYWRSRIRVASVLCLIVFWGAVVYCAAFSLGAIFALAEDRRPQDRVGAATLLISALVAGGVAVLSRIAGQANRRCERWAPMTMCILEALGVASIVVIGVVLAFDGGIVALVLMWIGALLPGVFAALFYRSWAAIPEYLSRPAWCRRALEYCGL